MVADLDSVHTIADGPDDAGGFATADMEVLGRTVAAGGDDIDRFAQCGPYIDEIDARSHDVDEHVVAPDGWDVDDLGHER